MLKVYAAQKVFVFVESQVDVNELLNQQEQTQESIRLLKRLIAYATNDYNTQHFIAALNEAIDHGRELSVTTIGEMRLMLKVVKRLGDKTDGYSQGKRRITDMRSCMWAIKRYLYLNHYSPYCADNMLAQKLKDLRNNGYNTSALEWEKERLEENLKQTQVELRRRLALEKGRRRSASVSSTASADSIKSVESITSITSTASTISISSIGTQMRKKLRYAKTLTQKRHS